MPDDLDTTPQYAKDMLSSLTVLYCEVSSLEDDVAPLGMNIYAEGRDLGDPHAVTRDTKKALESSIVLRPDFHQLLERAI